MSALAKVSKTNTALFTGAFVLSFVCLIPLHFHSTLSFWFFIVGVPGAFALLLVDGVHGDFNVLGVVVYVAVNTIFFYCVFSLVRYLFGRFI